MQNDQPMSASTAMGEAHILAAQGRAMLVTLMVQAVIRMARTIMPGIRFPVQPGNHTA